MSAIRSVGVVGCGLMGSGIAQVSAQAGYKTLVFDAAAGAVEKGLARIRASLEKLHEKGKISPEMRDRALDLLEPVDSLDRLSDTDLVIEAIVENLEAKKTLFAELDGKVQADAIFASNTSSLSISEMAEATSRPERFVGLHFFNPVPIMKLVEVVRADRTTDRVFETAFEFARSLGKVPIRAKDKPGFIVNRLLVPYLAEAIRMLERGDATKEDIDTGMTLGCGHPMGPITLLDYVGLDTTLFILEGWHQRFPDQPLFEPPALLREMVEKGLLGRKTGRGFYEWEGDKRK